MSPVIILATWASVFSEIFTASAFVVAELAAWCNGTSKGNRGTPKIADPLLDPFGGLYNHFSPAFWTEFPTVAEQLPSLWIESGVRGFEHRCQSGFVQNFNAMLVRQRFGLPSVTRERGNELITSEACI